MSNSPERIHYLHAMCLFATYDTIHKTEMYMVRFFLINEHNTWEHSHLHEYKLGIFTHSLDTVFIKHFKANTS